MKKSALNYYIRINNFKKYLWYHVFVCNSPGSVMFKYFFVIPFIVSVINCCAYSDNTIENSNIEEKTNEGQDNSTNDSNNKEEKNNIHSNNNEGLKNSNDEQYDNINKIDSNKKNNNKKLNSIKQNNKNNKGINSMKKNDKDSIDIFKMKQKDIQKLQEFLKRELKGSRNKNNETIKLIVKDVEGASNILNKITHNKKQYNKRYLEKQIEELNRKMQEIRELYNKLFAFPDQYNEDDKKITISNNNGFIKLPERNNTNVQAITSNNCPYSTRKDYLCIKPLSDEANALSEDVNDQKCVVIDLNSITRQQVQDYYNSPINGGLKDNNMQLQDTIPTKSYEDDVIGNKQMKDFQN